MFAKAKMQQHPSLPGAFQPFSSRSIGNFIEQRATTVCSPTFPLKTLSFLISLKIRPSLSGSASQLHHRSATNRLPVFLQFLVD